MVALLVSSKRIVPSVGFSLYVLLTVSVFPIASSIEIQVEDRIVDGSIVSEIEIANAKSLLISLGVPERNLCRPEALENREDKVGNDDNHWALPPCDSYLQNLDVKNLIGDFETDRQSRILFTEEEDEPNLDEDEDPLFYLVTVLGAVVCITLAALAAGLSMGMLSLDPLMLLVKIRASRSNETKEQAKALLPIIKRHHLLLVTLLLLNALANEALPLFLEKLVSPIVSVVLSVTFVLIFGEILPTAIFTGPKKLELASRLVPLVKLFIIILSPIAYPISRILDKYLHEDDEDGAFDRGEISALVRIQYEERLANKRQRKTELMDSIRFNPSSDFPHPTPRPPDLEAAIKNAKKDSMHPHVFSLKRNSEATQSIHVDEVTMVEGALQMKTKTALSVLTPLNRMFAVPDTLILNEDTVVDIYSSGYSRIPVYKPNPDKPKSKAAITGILHSKHLIVVNMNEDRALSTMPLITPPCVSPTMNLVELLNMFQTGRFGHFAVVCARQQIATEALNEGKAIPVDAVVMGVVTLEDVLEELLQEEIYDENDPMEKEAERIAHWVIKQWRRKKSVNLRSVGSVEDEATENLASESTSLLGTREKTQKDENRDSSAMDALLKRFVSFD